MGAYLTYKPHVGTTDVDRNCISNIRPEGLPDADAAFKIAAMLSAMRAGRISGVRLKDDTGPPARRRGVKRFPSTTRSRPRRKRCTAGGVGGRIVR